MAAMDLTNIMDGLAASMTAATLSPQVYAYPVESIKVPCAVVGYPTKIDFDSTFRRGSDTVELPVWFVVGRTGTKAARDALSAILADASSVKSALDGAHTYGDTAVTDATIEEVTVGGVLFLSAKFTVEIVS